MQEVETRDPWSKLTSQTSQDVEFQLQHGDLPKNNSEKKPSINFRPPHMHQSTHVPTYIYTTYTYLCKNKQTRQQKIDKASL